ncbi:MAG TPA: DUF4416 family protein [Gemmatales bacterium]|nr:DUF4416 family protein [Gemmatales bacterium]HMP60824.1 DUF4416 family protein [Gemmatales bacterium]
MRTLGQIEPQVLVVALFSRHEAALAEGRDHLVAAFGPFALVSPTFAFNHTDYYTTTMGTGLQKQLVAHERLVPMDSLAGLKRQTIAIEEAVRAAGRYAEPRPLNLDPGLLGLGKFCLATTKDQAHRIYLRAGIFAEVTLNFRDKAYHPNPWTYRDYREPFVLEFLGQVRRWYVQARCVELPASAE